MVLAAMVPVLLWPRPAWRALVAGAVGTVVLGAAWWLPSVFAKPISSAEGARAFAARSDSPLGVFGSLLGGGGIWNQAVLPPERSSLVLALLAAALLLAGIAADMAEMCPNAWLLNYTNPMAMNVTYLHKVAPDLKVLGLCHSVYWTMVGLCELIDVPYDEVSYWSAGVNHQAWVLRWERGGQNLYPLLDERIAADPEVQRRVRVDMYRRLGYYPTETSEHSSEYVPWYLHNPDEVARGLADFAALADADELIMTNPAPELAQRIRTLEIVAGLRETGS